MAIIEVTVCDVCRNPSRGTTRFQVWEGERSAVIDLCDEHAKPLRDLLTLDQRLNIKRRDSAAKAPARRKRTEFNSTVTTMDEIEARKQP